MRSLLATTILLGVVPGDCAPSLSITPAVSDLHGGITVLLSRSTPFESPAHGEVHCGFGSHWVPGLLRPDGQSVSCTVPRAPGGRLGSVLVAVKIDPLPDEQGQATLTYFDASKLPAISEVQPSVADEARPLPLRVLGSNFAPLSTAVCDFGTEGSTAATFVSSTELSCASPLVTPPSGASHSVDIRVSVDGVRFSASGAAPFTLTDLSAVPQLSRLSPHLGPASGGVALTLSGRGFSPAAGRLQCIFDGLEPSAASFDSTEAVHCTTPATASSAVTSVRVTVGSVGGSPPTSSTLPFVYFDPTKPPHIDEVSPAYGDVHTPPRLFLRGAGFAPVGPLLVCRLGTHQTAATFVSTAEIRCASPSTVDLAIGSVPVRAAIDGGAAWRAEEADRTAAAAEVAPRFLLYDSSLAPTATAVTPRYAGLGGGSLLTVRGSNLAPSPKLACVFEQVGLTPATMTGPTTLQCRAPAAAAALATSLTLTLDHATLSSPSLSFSFVDEDAVPSVAAVRPPAADLLGGTLLTLLGANFRRARAMACVFMPQAAIQAEGGASSNASGAPAVTAATHVSMKQVKCVSPASPLLTGTVRVHLWSSDAPSTEAALQAALAAATDALDAAATDPPPALSSSSAPLTLYDAASPPTLTQLSPSYTALSAGSSLTSILMLGRNFAPTDAGVLCGFDGGASDIATFVNASAVRCDVQLPVKPSEQHVHVSIDGGTSWSPALPLTFYEPRCAREMPPHSTLGRLPTLAGPLDPWTLGRLAVVTAGVSCSCGVAPHTRSGRLAPVPSQHATCRLDGTRCHRRGRLAPRTNPRRRLQLRTDGRSALRLWWLRSTRQRHSRQDQHARHLPERLLRRVRAATPVVGGGARAHDARRRRLVVGAGRAARQALQHVAARRCPLGEPRRTARRRLCGLAHPARRALLSTASQRRRPRRGFGCGRGRRRRCRRRGHRPPRLPL